MSFFVLACEMASVKFLNAITERQSARTQGRLGVVPMQAAQG